jgi:hypothetical protein
MFQTIRPTFFFRSSDTGGLSNVASPTVSDCAPRCLGKSSANRIMK